MLISDLKRMTRFIAQHRTSLTHSELDNTQVHDLSARTKSVERAAIFPLERSKQTPM